MKALRQKAALVGDAIQKLIDDLDLHSTLKGAGVDRDQSAIVATKITGEKAKGSEFWEGSRPSWTTLTSDCMVEVRISLMSKVVVSSIWNSSLMDLHLKTARVPETMCCSLLRYDVQ